MNKLFDEETGLLLLDELVFHSDSFQAIIADNAITDDEIIRQANLVVELFRKLDQQLNDEDKKIVMEAIAECAVLYQINAIKGGK